MRAPGDRPNLDIGVIRKVPAKRAGVGHIDEVVEVGGEGAQAAVLEEVAGLLFGALREDGEDDGKNQVTMMTTVLATNVDALLLIADLGTGLMLWGNLPILLGLGYLVTFVFEHFGFRLNPEVYYIDRLPVSIDPMEFVVVGLIALAVCVVSTIFPAVLASRLRPVDALRLE